MDPGSGNLGKGSRAMEVMKLEVCLIGREECGMVLEVLNLQYLKYQTVPHAH